MISFGSVSSVTTWSFWSGGEETAARFRARLAVTTIEGAVDAALAGAGLIRATSYQVVDHVRAGRLATALEDFEPPAPPVHLVYDQQNRLPLKLRAFVDYATPRLRERLTAAALS